MIFDSLTFTANKVPLILGNITKIKFGWNFDQKALCSQKVWQLFITFTQYCVLKGWCKIVQCAPY